MNLKDTEKKCMELNDLELTVDVGMGPQSPLCPIMQGNPCEKTCRAYNPFAPTYVGGQGENEEYLVGGGHCSAYAIMGPRE